jgi:hypothetical protein
MNVNFLRPKAAQLSRVVGVFGSLILGSAGLEAQSVQLRWAASSDTNITGYVIYAGSNATNFAAADVVGNVTNYTLTSLSIGQTYFVGVAALNDLDLESALTNLTTSFRFNGQPGLVVPVEVRALKNTAKPVTGMVISDDKATANYTMSLSSTRGVINVLTNVSGGVTGGQVAGNGSGSVTITASLAALNATLGRSNGVVYTGRLNLVGADVVIATVSDNDAVGFGGVASTIQTITFNVQGDKIDTWRNQNFAVSDLTDTSREATVWGDLADPDNDGLQNLMEYALSMNPTNRESSSVGVFSDLVELSGKNYLSLSFRQLKSAPIEYVPQVSTDKQMWSSGTNVVQLVSTVDVDAQTQIASYKDFTPIDPLTPRFMRLKIVRNQP